MQSFELIQECVFLCVYIFLVARSPRIGSRMLSCEETLDLSCPPSRNCVVHKRLIHCNDVQVNKDVLRVRNGCGLDGEH